MGMLSSYDFAEPAAYLASTEQLAAGLGKANVGKLWAPYEPWRAVASVANAWVGFSVTTAVDLANSYLVLDRVNVALLRIEVANDDGFSTNLLTSASLATAVDPLDGRRKYFHKLSTLGTGTRTRFRVRAESAVTVDGSAAFMVGSMGVVRTHTAWARNFTFPLGETPLRAARVDDTRVGGGRRPVGVGNQYCRLSLSTSNWPWSMRADALDFLRAGEDKLLWFAPDGAAPTRSYLGWLVGQATLRQEMANKLTLAGLVLEEAV